MVGLHRSFVDHGFCSLGARDAVCRTASSVASETNAGVAVFVAESANVAVRGEVSMCLCLLTGSPLFGQYHLLTYLQMFLEQTEPATTDCCGVFPDLCVDVQSFHVALADIFIP